MKKVFRKIYLNLANLTRDAVGGNMHFVYAKPLYLVMKSWVPFLTSIQTSDIGLKQRLSKKTATECIVS